MEYSLSNSLVGGSGSINPDGLSLDLQFASDKTLTARRGPTPVLTRANTTATFVGINGTLQNATTNVARFDHNKSYSSAYLVLSGSPLDNNGFPVDISNALNFTSWDESIPVKYPQFNYGSINLSINGDYWYLYANDGDFVAQRLISDGINGSYSILSGSGTLTVTAVHPCKGLLIEDQRQNLLTDTNGMLSTQTKTVTAVQHTLSFYGTGQIVLSGAAIETVSPASNYGDRKILTFTPSAGSLIVTVTGSVEFAQLEIGAFATSFIPTSGSSLIRSADVCSITGTDFSGVYKQGEGTFFVAGDARAGINSSSYLVANNGTNQTGISIFRDTTNNTFGVASGGSFTAMISVASANGSFNKIAGSYFTNDARAAFNGSLQTQDTSVTVPTNLTRFNIGSSLTANEGYVNGCISSICYYKKRLSNAKLQSLTT